jgi:psp operon transcriptional activator
VGSSVPIHVDVRIVAATNADLPDMAKSGRFKQDLLDRLSFEVIYVPPLRHRPGDIIFLANHFAARMAYELGHHDSPSISEKAVKALESYVWPGNVRELKNVIERAVYKSDSGRINRISFDPFVNPYGKELKQPDAQAAIPSPSEPVIQESVNPDETPMTRLMTRINDMPLKTAIGEVEKILLNQALVSCRYNQKQAASKLRLTYDQFRGIMRKHAIKQM